MSVAVFAAFLLLLLAFCAPLAAQHAPKKPFVESSWVAEMSYESKVLGEGRIVFDLNPTDSKSSRALIQTSFVELSQGTVNNKTFAVDLERFRGTYMLSNSSSSYNSLSCNYAFNETFVPLFDLTSSGWLSGNLTIAHHSPTSTIWQIECTRNTTSYPYTLTNEGLCANVDLYGASTTSGASYYGWQRLEVDAKGIPLSLSYGGESYSSVAARFVFHSFTKSNQITLAKQPFPEVCRGERCPANTTSTEIELFRQHGNSTLFKQLDDVNLADSRGESYWLCDYGGLTKSYSPIVSKFRLTISPDYSAYSLCNGGSCSVNSYSQMYGIGKQYNSYSDICHPELQSAGNVTCKNNNCNGAGAWYSFPKMGRCAPGAPLGTDNCKWLDKYTTIKSITIDCIKSVGFQCVNETTIDDLAAYLNTAFAVCPDVQDTVGNVLTVEDFVATDQSMPSLSSTLHHMMQDNRRRK